MSTTAIICLILGALAGSGWARSFAWQRRAKQWESHALGLRSELHKWSSGTVGRQSVTGITDDPVSRG